MEADVLPAPTQEKPKKVSIEEDVVKKLESFSLTSKSRTSVRCLPKKRLRCASGGDERSLNFALRARHLPPKLSLRRSKLDHLFRSNKHRTVLRSSVLSKRLGSAPPPEIRVYPPSDVDEPQNQVDSTSSENKAVSLRGAGSKSCSSLPDATVLHKTCSQEAANFAYEEVSSVDELAGYLENGLHIPKKMSLMAEMMYT